MKIKLISAISLLLFLLGPPLTAQELDFVNPYSFELSGGIKAPYGLTTKDIVAGLSFRMGVGYMLNKHFELAHLGVEIGSSSPPDPEMTVLQDWYDPYYGRMAMETIIFVGTPLTSRIHFKLNDYFDAFVGVGGAWYWFSTRMDDPYWGELKKPRNRSGFGGLGVFGVNTNLFSDNFLVSLKIDMELLKTSGKTLAIQSEDDKKVTRWDKYFTFSIGMRYTFDR